MRALLSTTKSGCPRDTLLGDGRVSVPPLRSPSPAGRSVNEVTSQALAGQLAYHRTLLADRLRNDAFHRAIAARVRPGQSVVDLGSGSGIWAIVAAKCGAARVVAVEREPLLCALIERLAHENGVSAQVEVVCADVLTVELNREFDVAISETIGTSAFEEGIVAHLARARDYFVRPKGALIPEQVGLRAAPVFLSDLAAAGLLTSTFSSLASQVPHWVGPGRARTLARARDLLSVDVRRADPAQPLPAGHAEFSVPDASRVSGLAVWVDVRLAPGVRLTTRASTHWGVTVLPIEPPRPGPAWMRFEVDWNPKRRRWSVEIVREGEDSTRADHSPLFALASLLRGEQAGPSR